MSQTTRPLEKNLRTPLRIRTILSRIVAIASLPSNWSGTSTTITSSIVMCNHFSRQWYLELKHRLAALVNTAERQLQPDQAWYKRHLNAHLHRTADNVSADNSVFVEFISANQPHKLATFASGPLSIVNVDPHTVTKQRADNSDEKRSRNRVAKKQIHVQVLFQDHHMLFTTILMCRSYPPIVIIALSLLTAPLLRRRYGWYACQIRRLVHAAA